MKWIGNKQRFAPEIISHFPSDFQTYFEPFLGSGAVLATLAPSRAVASDSFQPLIEVFVTLKRDPARLKRLYADRWNRLAHLGKKAAYEEIKRSYNEHPNAADLLFLSRACYGGVVRFRKDGYISTPVGIHNPISPKAFAERVDEWGPRISHTRFLHLEYGQAMRRAEEGDLVYCDPPYSFSQSILYGAQSFDLQQLLSTIAACKARGVRVALSIDGTKRSGDFICDIPLPQGLFEREVLISVGRSMLKRFQMNGKKLDREHVHDRLLLTY